MRRFALVCLCVCVSAFSAYGALPPKADAERVSLRSDIRFTLDIVLRALVDARTFVVRECEKRPLLSEQEIEETIAEPLIAREKSFAVVQACEAHEEKKRLLFEALSSAWMFYELFTSPSLRRPWEK
jgi:hypothetical protein